MRVEEKLEQLGYRLPEVTKPLANYVPGVRVGPYVYVSGQLPMVEGKLVHQGKLGRDCTLEEGYEAARVCALNCMGVLKSLIGDLDQVEQIVKIVGFVRSAEGFTDQPKVINGASDLFGQVFGPQGIHARSAVGAAELPLGAPCEVELIALIKE